MIFKNLPFSTPFKVLFLYAVGLIILMQFWHLMFLFSQYPQIELNNIFLYIHSFWIALRLDGVVTGFILLPFLLTIYIPIIGWTSKTYINVSKYYFLFISCIYSLLCLVDIEFYKELGSHLNFILWQQGTFSQETWKLIWVDYPLILYIIFVLIISYFWMKIIQLFLKKINPDQFSILKKSFSFIFSIIIIGLLSRGGWQERPIDWGHSMFSKNNLANQVALNPIFNLGRSLIQFTSEDNISNLIQFMDNDKAMQVTRELIQSPNEVFLDSNSFNRKIISPNSIKPNIILVVLESFVANFCGHINSKMSQVTPNLDYLAKNGIMCTKCIALGKRSAFGLSSILCSWPVLPGFPIISQLESQEQTETIASLLKKIGYSSYFLYGGDANFDNMKGFAMANGFDVIIDRDSFPIGTPGTMWGIYDEYVFNKTQSLMDMSGNPNFILLFTTTNHQPWKVPDTVEKQIPLFTDQNYNKIETLRTMAYTDKVIGEFINNNRQKTWFDNTIFVFISDHSLNIYNGMYEDPRNAHIPAIIYAPKIIDKPKLVDEYTNQVDIAITLLHLIGYPLPFNLMGKNILSSNYEGIACRIVNDYFMWYESDFLYTGTLGQENNLYSLSNLYDFPYLKILNENKIEKQIQTNFEAYLQSAYNSFKTKNHKITLNN